MKILSEIKGPFVHILLLINYFTFFILEGMKAFCETAYFLTASQTVKGGGKQATFSYFLWD